MNAGMTPELQAQAAQALDYQKTGRFAEAAQSYAALLLRAPQLWPACYNLGLVYQHLDRLPEAAEMYARAVRLNPRLAEGFNNLGNVFKALKNNPAAIEAYQQALALNANLPQASYNLATMLQARGDLEASIALLKQAVSLHSGQQNAWDALYRGLLGLGRQEEAIQAFLDWERAAIEPTPDLVIAGLALCRPMADRQRESQYLQFAITWPFDEFAPASLSTVLGMLQHFDVTRDQLLACYRRYDAAMTAAYPLSIAQLPRRAADSRLRIAYVSADFRRHAMGRLMLEVVSRHDRNRFSILLISTCPRSQYDAITSAFRTHAEGFADISELDDFEAAKSIAEADVDVLVDLAGHTMAARPGIYLHRPARSIVTHLGYHGCLGLGAVDYKLTDRIADGNDAAQYQIERPYILDSCIFPLVRMAASDIDLAVDGGLDLSGKFVFGEFVNVLKLSARCLYAWKRVLDIVPEAILLFSPFNIAEKRAIERLAASAGIDASRIAVLIPKYQDDAALRARYQLVHAVMDTFPYAGGDTTLAALDMNVPVVTLCGKRHSERVGASILGHLGLMETVADTEDIFVDICVRLARDAAFLSQVRERIATATAANPIDAESHARSLERAFVEIAGRKPVAASMALGARPFFQSLHDAMRRQRAATDDQARRAIAAVYAELHEQQPEYPPLLRAQAELAQDMNDLALASNCLAAFLKQSPDDADARLTLAGFLTDQGAAADALMVMNDAWPSATDDVRVLILRTRAHVLLRQWEMARQTSAAAVDIAPADAQAHFWHGTVLSHVGEPEAALSFLNRALILVPNHGDAAYNAGVLLAEMGNHVDAEKVFRRALDAGAAQAAQLRLLHVLRLLGREDDWRVEGLRFVATYRGDEVANFIDSRIARADGNLEREAEILLPLAERVATTQNHALAAELIAELLPILPYHDVSPRLLERLRARYGEAVRALDRPPAAREIPIAGMEKWPRKLGYMVDFSLPFSTELVTALTGHHDRDRFAITIYTLSPHGSVPLQALHGAGARVVMLAAFDEVAVADRIRADELDFLVDAGGGDYAKPGVLARRLATVQLSLPGLTRPAGTGEFDGRISDRVLEVNGSADPIGSAPWRLDGCAIPILPPVARETGLTPDTLGLTPAVCVFGILASAERISSRCLTLWKSISERLPSAVFLVSPLDARESGTVRRMLLNATIATGRIFIPPASFRRGRGPAFAGVVDVILDTLPGNDYYSALTAVAEGIPLVSISGKMPEERIALSIMFHLGETSTIAASGRDYVDLAVALATDTANRRALVTRLQTRWQQSSGDVMPLSMRSYTQRTERALMENHLRNAEGRAGGTRETPS